jgi:TRAP-type C4-dicarboxylate transport system permease small subunit
MGTTIRVDTLTMVLSAKIQRIITLICSVLMIVFLSLLIIGGIDLVKSAAEIGQASPALGIPVANMYRLMVIGFGLTIFRYAELIVRVLTGRDLETEGENK